MGVLDRLLEGVASDEELRAEMLVGPDGRRVLVNDHDEIVRLKADGYLGAGDTGSEQPASGVHLDDLAVLAEVVHRFSRSNAPELRAWAAEGDRHLGRLYRRRHLADQIAADTLRRAEDPTDDLYDPEG